MSDETTPAIETATGPGLAVLWTDPYKRRWLGWAVLSFAFLLVGLHRESTAVLAGELQRTFETTGAGLGLLHSSFFYLYAVLQLPGGMITDYAGSRRTAVYGTLLMSAGALTFAVSSTYAVAFGSRALIGLGASVVYLATLRFCANWFRANEFATMSGLTIAVSALGGILATTPLAIAIERTGWREPIFGLGVLGVLGAGAIHFVVRNTPEAGGLAPIEEVPPTAPQTAGDVGSNLTRVLRNPVTWLLGVMLFFGVGVTFTIFGLWGVPYLVQSYGLTVTQASAYVLAAGIGWLFGPPVFGAVSDRLETRTPLILVSVVAGTAVWVSFAVLGTPDLVVVGFLFVAGRFIGGGATLAFTVVKEQFDTAASGTAIGAVNSMGWLGAAVFPVLIGVVLDAFWTGETIDGARVYTETGYRAGFALAAAAVLVMVVCAVLVHRMADA